MHRRSLRYGWMGLLVALAGCSRGPQFAEVEGAVTRGGTPLKNVRVEFWPNSDGPKSTAVTDDNGRYVLKSEDGTTPGAVVGSHKVVVKDLSVLGNKFLGRKGENTPTLNPNAQLRFSPLYSDPARSDLTRDVTPGTKNQIDIELK